MPSRRFAQSTLAIQQSIAVTHGLPDARNNARAGSFLGAFSKKNAKRVDKGIKSRILMRVILITSYFRRSQPMTGIRG